jgi:hypothetical protein
MLVWLVRCAAVGIAAYAALRLAGYRPSTKAVCLLILGFGLPAIYGMLKLFLFARQYQRVLIDAGVPEDQLPADIRVHPLPWVNGELIAVIVLMLSAGVLMRLL